MTNPSSLGLAFWYQRGTWNSKENTSQAIKNNAGKWQLLSKKDLKQKEVRRTLKH
jgi:hypothetical protein